MKSWSKKEQALADRRGGGLLYLSESRMDLVDVDGEEVDCLIEY